MDQKIFVPNKFYQRRKELTLPSPNKPIPIATVKVYFVLEGIDQITMKYRFENDSLIHYPDRTIRISQMESFIENFLDKKLLTRNNVLFLGTSFESSRIKDDRLDKLMVKQIQVPVIQQKYIDPQLLEDQIIKIDKIVQTQEIYQTILKNVKKYFSEQDKQNLKTVSIQQFHKIIEKMNLRLSKQQLETVTNSIDKKNIGIITYDQYFPFGVEVVRGLMMMKQAQLFAKNKEQQFRFEAQILLANHQIFQKKEQLQSSCRQKDQQQTGKVNITDVKGILDTWQQSIMSKQEISQFAKYLSKIYMYNEVKIEELHDQLIQFKKVNLTEGLCQENLSKLEKYLRQAFNVFDQSQLGKIHLTDMIKALLSLEKIKLPIRQHHILRSCIQTDQFDMLSIKQSTKILTQLIKRLFIPFQEFEPS